MAIIVVPTLQNTPPAPHQTSLRPATGVVTACEVFSAAAA
jgi:hypothetical protein